MIVKRVVCLANSRKLTGRCVAGVVINEDLEWVRPVSDRGHEEVSERERQYEDGSDSQVLDIIDIPLIKHAPRDFQRENWLLDPEHYWVKVGQLNPEQLNPYCQIDGTLWINGESTYHGLHDQIALDVAQHLETSLCLVFAQSVTLRVLTKGELFDNPKRVVRAQFQFDNVAYDLSVTDPKIERAYLAKDNGSYAIGPCFLTVSLSEPWKGHTYKLVAAVIPTTEEASLS